MQTGGGNSRAAGFYSEWDGSHERVLSRVKQFDLQLPFYAPSGCCAEKRLQGIKGRRKEMSWGAAARVWATG